MVDEFAVPKAPLCLEKPEALLVIVACAMVCAIVGVCFICIKLQGVLVPLVFAILLAFLIEPILATIVLAPTRISSWGRRCMRRRFARGEDATTESPRSDNSWSPRGLWFVLARIWDGTSLVLCVVLIVSISVGVSAAVFYSFASFDWNKYANSQKIHQIQDELLDYGINITDLTVADITAHFSGQEISIAASIMSVSSDIVVTLLLFIFCLLALLPGIRSGGPRSRVKCLLQRYMLCKSISSLIVSSAVMLALALLRVDFVFVFGLLTFVLNFIPNTGSLFAMLAPLPFVLLSPDKDLQDVVYAFLIPFIIHNSLGCMVDIRVLSGGLELHPFTVVTGLLFWGSLWGVAGAILSVPITCCLKLCIEDIKHPYARMLYHRFEYPFGKIDADSPTAKLSPEDEVSRETREAPPSMIAATIAASIGDFEYHVSAPETVTTPLTHCPESDEIV
jgi:predicted PurR-regulated permease PerM